MRLTFEKDDLRDNAKDKLIEDINIFDLNFDKNHMALCAAANYIEYESDFHIKIIKCRSGGPRVIPRVIPLL
jgi:hypothetical protein